MPSYSASHISKLPPILSDSFCCLLVSVAVMHASGITVDDEVLSEFSTARQDPATLFLQYRIQSDRFHRTSSAQRSSSRDGDFTAMQRALSPSEPCFLVARPTPAVSGASGSDKWQAHKQIDTYVPQACLVGNKLNPAAATGTPNSHSYSPVFSLSADRGTGCWCFTCRMERVCVIE